MDTISKNIIITISNKFVQSFFKQLTKELNKLQKYNFEPAKFMPKILTKNFGVRVIFSIEKGHYMLIFNDSNLEGISHKFVNGDVIDAFDGTGNWKSDKSSGISIDNCTSINLKNISFHGIKPFTLSGSSIEMYIDNMDFSLPIGSNNNIKYAIVLSFQKLVDYVLNIDEFTCNFVFAYWYYFHSYKEKLDSTSDKFKAYISNLEMIKQKMVYYFYDKHVLEKEIENFIQENSIVISQVLGLEKPIFQAKLKDINGFYNQVLIPDLMGFNQIQDNWTIVDYKLGRGANLIQSPGGVRVKFYESVAKLEAQLRVYRKYFNEMNQLAYFNRKYNTNINEFPETIGIIGYVDKESRKDFNELLLEKPRWFNLIPYNDIETKFEQFISTIKSIN